MIMSMHYEFLSFVALVIIHCTVCEVTTSWNFSKSWRSNVEIYDDISLALGDRHVRDHFPSSLLLTEAIHHQLEILHKRALGPASDVDRKDSRFVFKVQHPFLSCTKYLEYNSTLTSFKDFFGDSFQPHVTLTSAAADKVCFISFVEDSTALDFYLSAPSLIVHLPVPDVLKFDHSILHAIDWTIDQQLNSGKNLRSGELSKKFKHPILKDVTRGLPVELSFTYRSSWSSQSQEHSTNQLMEKLLSRSSKDVDNHISSRVEHWDNFVWGTARGFPESDSQIRAQSQNSRRQMRAAEIRRYQPWEITQYTSVFNRVVNLPPLQSTVDRSDAVKSDHLSDDSKLQSIREKWSTMGDNYVQLLSQQSRSPYETQHCNYADIVVQHREKNVILKLGRDFFSSAESAGACFSNLVVLLSSDPGVTRIALSKPMSTQNKSARPIMQTGTLTSEAYSDAGLDGTGVVVGISDTGIDEESCFFKDPKGAVRRSSALNPFTDPSYRKVIQYVNYSGGGGDVFAGHGSHVAGSVAGNNPADASYRGMAPMAKLAFFDIMAFKAEEGDLSVPSDLSKYIFNSSYKAGARIHSNSWGGGYWYDAYCLEVDEFIYDHDDFLIFFAAGNNGMSGKGTLLSPGLSKNSVSVAASHNSKDIGNVAYFSSIGPTPDGRTKPDVTAPGYLITSAEAQLEGTSLGNCGTTKKAGTSMATPVTAGTAALVLQYFKDAKFWAKYCNPVYTLCAKGAFSPKGALIKALLLHSAVPMSTYVAYQSLPLKKPPDTYQGYGRVDLKQILPLESYTTNQYALFIDQSTLTSLTELTYKVKVTSVAVDLRATISWMDPPNPEFSARVLVHDLDLLLVGPDGPNAKTYYGNSDQPVRDELNNNEQITITSSNGLTVGTYIVHVQAKMLHFVPTQNFSIVITLNGAVSQPLAGTVPSPISAVLLQKCRGGATFTDAKPLLSIEQSLFNQATAAGWSAADYTTISSVYVAQSEEKVASYSERVEVSRSKFTEKTSYAVSDNCLPSGCYEAALYVDLLSKPSTSMSIPKCGVFLAPMRTSQVFCVDKSVSMIDATTQKSLSVFEQDSCSPLCALVPHVTFDMTLFEGGGSGWMGGYYAITPLIQFPTEMVATFNGHQVTNVSAVSAGTLEWSFSDERSICVPLGNYYRNTPKVRSRSLESHTLNSEEEEEEEEQGGERQRESKRNTLESQAAAVTAPACYIMHLSVPTVTPVVQPMMQFLKAWTLPLAKGMTGATGDECTYFFRPNITYGIVCVNPSLGEGNITFYKTNSSHIGQIPIMTPIEMYTAYTPYNSSIAGVCGFPLTYHQGRGFQNITNVSQFQSKSTPSSSPLAAKPVPGASSAAPSTSKSPSLKASPSIKPSTAAPSISRSPSSKSSPSSAPSAAKATPGSTSAAPSSATSKYTSKGPTRLTPIPGMPTYGPSMSLASTGNFSCLALCPNFPGLSAFDQPSDKACNFFHNEIFYLCDSFTISNGLCEIPACASQCTLKEYCYYGANVAVDCTGVWGYHTSPKVEEMIKTCMAAQYSAPGDALGVSSSKTEKLTTKSVAIVAGVLSAACVFCLFGFCIFCRRSSKGMDGVRYSTLSGKSKISEATHDDPPVHDIYDDLQEVELNSPFPPVRASSVVQSTAPSAPPVPIDPIPVDLSGEEVKESLKEGHL